MTKKNTEKEFDTKNSKNIVVFINYKSKSFMYIISIMVSQHKFLIIFILANSIFFSGMSAQNNSRLQNKQNDDVTGIRH